MGRVKYSKKTSPRLMKTVCVILPRVDVNEFLRERRRRSLSITQNVASSTNSTSVSTSVQTTALKLSKRRCRVKKEPPCIFHSQVDIDNDDTVEEIPAVLREPVQHGSICLHDITRSMCYMCSPRYPTAAAEDKFEIWNEINNTACSSSTSQCRSWHVPTPFTPTINNPNTTASSEQIIEPQINPNAAVSSNLSFQNIHTTSSGIETHIPNTTDTGVGTGDDFVIQTREQSTQTVRYFSCKHCLALFTDVGHLIHHKSVHQKTFECPFCPANFASKTDLKSHMKLHMLPKYYDCVYCPQAFTKKHDIREHLSLHAEQRQFHCQLCPATFKQKNNLRNHEQSHKVSKFIHVFKKIDDNEPAKKSTSPNSPEKSVVSDHEKNATEISTGSTSIGGTTKSAKRSVFFTNHKRLTNTTFSGVRHPISSYLELSSIRDGPSTSGFTCPTIMQPTMPNSSTNTETPDISAKRAEELPTHKVNFFQCRFCPMSFKQYGGLKTHNICHTRKTGKFVCTACGGKFTKKLGLVLHTRFSHTTIM